MTSRDAFAERDLLAAPVVGRASWLVPARIDTPELLDLGHGTPQDVRANLDEMWRINRYLGGFRALTAHLYPRLAAVSGPASVLDLGTGAGEAARAIAQWGRRRDCPVRVLAVDWTARHLDVARHTLGQTPDVTLLRADATRLPLAAESVDYVISTLFLHHFAPEAVIRLLRSAFATARRGMIMSDLVRGWLPWAAFRLATPVFARHYLTRHDGLLSVRRAYTPDELRELADAAGLREARVHTHFPWRMTLVVDR